MIVKVLESLTTEANFAEEKFGGNGASSPRKRNRPVRYEVGNAGAEFYETVEGQYRQIVITKQLTQVSTPYETVSVKIGTKLRKHCFESNQE